MTFIALRTPITIRMRFKTIAKLLVVSIVILAGSPALATQIARHDVHYGFCEQNEEVCRHRTLGPCISPEIDTPHWNRVDKTHDDWPANMILG
jgi:hypothetical protein